MSRTSLLVALLLATAAHATEPAVPGEEVVGRWQGTYLCTQGWTGLDLTIRIGEPQAPGKELEATFAFYEIARNPGVPSGRFRMRGHFDPDDGHVDFEQDHWLERPARYVMVNLHGKLDPAKETLAGRVSGPGCGDFELRRAEGPPTADSWLTGP